MSDVEILRAAEKIIRQCQPATEHESQVFRNTMTGLLWARADLLISQQRTYFAALTS